MIASVLKIIEIILILISKKYQKEKDLEKEFREAIAHGDLDVASDILRKRISDIKRSRSNIPPPNGSK